MEIFQAVQQGLADSHMISQAFDQGPFVPDSNVLPGIVYPNDKECYFYDYENYSGMMASIALADDETMKVFQFDDLGLGDEVESMLCGKNVWLSTCEKPISSASECEQDWLGDELAGASTNREVGDGNNTRTGFLTYYDPVGSDGAVTFFEH